MNIRNKLFPLLISLIVIAAIVIIIVNIFKLSITPEPNLQLSNPEAFSFDLGDSWEINSSVKAKGFAQNEMDDNYSINLSYSVDFLSKSDTLLAIYNDSIKETANEEFLDCILEAQIEIDSTFGEGDYTLIYNVKDELSKQERTISVDFNLSK